jgi:hypothetical protein
MWRMSDHDSFEDRLRAIADELGRSVRRLSELDIDELSQQYGVDADQARAFADAAGQWLTDRLSSAEPLFGQVKHPEDESELRGLGADLDLEGPPQAGRTPSGTRPGPHPLDLPSEAQGLTLSALDSGRWTVRSGSNQLAGTGVGAEPVPSDVVGELRARDWITATGTLTLVGRHALGRWCRTVEEPPDDPMTST